MVVEIFTTKLGAIGFIGPPCWPTLYKGILCRKALLVTIRAAQELMFTPELETAFVLSEIHLGKQGFKMKFKIGNDF